MKIHYQPNEYSRIRRNYPSTPLDVEKLNILRDSVEHEYNIELLEENKERLVFKVSELNHHFGTVEIYPKYKCCSCKQYHKTETSYCKHIAILEWFLNNPVWNINNGHQLQSILKSQLRLSSINTYRIWNSLSNITVDVGYGSNIIQSSSILQNDKTNYQFDEINLIESDYALLDNVSLYDYQRDILKKMLSAKRGILSMVMGSGKTISSIAAIKYINPPLTLIVCPKTIISQWQKEISRLLNKSVILLKSNNLNNITNNNIYICTYQMLSRNIDKICHNEWDMVIADEIQFIRNDEGKTWKSFNKIKSKYFYGLSGTIIENRLDDLYSIMNIVRPDFLGPKWKFDATYKVLQSITPRKVLYQNQVQNIEKLKEKIKDFVWSYDAIKLPPIDHQFNYVHLNQMEQRQHDYFMTEANRLIAKSLTGESSPSDKFKIQALLLKARQCCNTLELVEKRFNPNNEKICKILDIINSADKIVVYSSWTEMLDIIERELDKKQIKFIRLDGQMSIKNRELSLEKFKSDNNIRVFTSSDAGGLGIDGLQLVCSNVLHCELPWNPAKIDQRNGRVHRLLQTNPVTIHYVITKNSIESKIESLLKDKREVRLSTLF